MGCWEGARTKTSESLVFVVGTELRFPVVVFLVFKDKFFTHAVSLGLHTQSKC